VDSNRYDSLRSWGDQLGAIWQEWGGSRWVAPSILPRREWTDHLIVLNQRHLLAQLEEYVRYYNTIRPHLSLNRNSPRPREPDPPANGHILSTPILGGLHHEYRRVA